MKALHYVGGALDISPRTRILRWAFITLGQAPKMGNWPQDAMTTLRRGLLGHQSLDADPKMGVLTPGWAPKMGNQP